MKLNEHTALLTPQLLLVPYSEHHVPTYHEWMQDEDLQKATASEPLSIPEEYAMQKSWRTDADKLTFIVCLAPPISDAETLEAGKQDNPTTMIGDINLFLSEDESDDETEGADSEIQNVVGEIEIMIARKDLQGKGLGQYILLTFLWHIAASLNDITEEWNTGCGNGKPASSLKYLRVKIGEKNTRSIKLFEKVGFKKVSEHANYFGELELRRALTSASGLSLEKELSATPRILRYP